jgi:hypothetical protein
MKLSEHFSLAEATFSEAGTRKGLINEPDAAALVHMLEAAKEMERVRDLLGRGIHVNSWFRSPDVNAAVGSSSTSDHLKGFAIDFTCPAFGTPLEVCKTIVASSIEFSQLIWEGTWVHISFNPARIHKREVLTAHFAPGRKPHYTKGLP